MTTNDVLFKVIASIDKLYEFRGEKHDDQEERRRNGFDIEFSNLKNLSAGLKQSKEHVTNAGMIAENKKKNRYKDIMPFDVSRVKLDVIKEDSNSDYINASFVDGVGCSRAYVASQGPLPHTLLDFWRMLWQYNIHVIVMVCRQVEMGKRKCEKYWADQEEVKQFGDITVTLSDSQNPNTSYCIRTLKAERENETRYIRQFHYVCWPDHGVPKTCYEILQMINHIREFQPYSRDAEIPLCVHCSAGCGRTGAVLAVDYARNLLDKKKVTSGFSVYDIVCNMRKQRPAIVQTRDQYEFVNAAISEMFKIYMQTRSLKHKDFVKQAQVGAYENVILPVKSTSNSGEAKVIQEPKVAEHLATRSYENIEFVHRQMHNAHTENGNDRASSPSKEHADDKPPAKPGRIISNNLSRPTSAYVVSTSPANPTHGVLGSGYGLGREDRRPSIPNSLGLSKISNGNAKAQGRHRTPLSASNFNTKDVSPKPSPVGTPPRVKPILNIEAATMHKTEGAKSPGTGECTTQKPPLAPKIMIAPKIASPVESTKPKAPVKPRRTVKKANSYQQKASSLSDDGPPEPQKGTPPASSSSVQGNLAKYKRNHLYNDIDLSPGKNPSIVPETEYDTIRDRRVIPRSNSSSSVERNRSQTPKPRNPNRSTGDTPPRLPNRTAESRVMISESPPALPDRTEDSYITIAVDGEEDHQPYEAVSSTPIIPETKPAENGRRGSSNPSTSLAAKAKGMLGKTTSAFSKVGASISKTLEDESTSQRPPTMSERSPTYVQGPVIYGGQDMSFGKRLVKKVKGTRKLK